MFKKREISEKVEEITSEELFQSLINDFTNMKIDEIQGVQSGRISHQEFMEEARYHVRTHHNVSEAVLTEALNRFKEYMFGYSRLTPLLEDLDISDVHCVSYKSVWYKKNGQRYRSDIQFSSELEYQNFVDYVATKNQANLSNMNAIQRFSDISTFDHSMLRFTITMPLVNMVDYPYLHIRRTLKNFPKMNDLVSKGMMSVEVAEELIRRFRTGSMLICGGNSAGKTTLINALKETLPDNWVTLVVQQNDELSTQKDCIMYFMHSIPGAGEAKMSYELDKISIAGITMDIDYFILGEIKGDEAADVLKAAYSGQLCAATIHSPSADTAPDKIVDYAMKKLRYSKEELMKMLCCFKNMVFMKDYKVDQIDEILGWDELKKEIRFNRVYRRM